MKKIITIFLASLLIVSAFCLPASALANGARDYPAADVVKAVGVLATLAGVRLDAPEGSNNYDVIQSLTNALYMDDSTDAHEILAMAESIVNKDSSDFSLSPGQLRSNCTRWANIAYRLLSFPLYQFGGDSYYHRSSATDIVLSNGVTLTGRYNNQYDYTRSVTIDKDALLADLQGYCAQTQSVLYYLPYDIATEAQGLSTGSYMRFLPFSLSSESGFTLRANGIVSDSITAINSTMYYYKYSTSLNRNPLYIGMDEVITSAGHDYSFVPAGNWESVHFTVYSGDMYIVPVPYRDADNFGLALFTFCSSDSQTWEVSCNRYNWRYQQLDGVNYSSYDNINTIEAHFGFLGARLDADIVGSVNIGFDSDVAEKWTEYPGGSISGSYSGFETFNWSINDITDKLHSFAVSRIPLIPTDSESPEADYGVLGKIWPSISNTAIGRISMNISQSTAAFEALKDIIDILPAPAGLLQSMFAFSCVTGLILVVLL